MIQPIFIFSLPRSGSTLLQKILTTHSEIETTAEPWILLPYIYAQKDTGIQAIYDQHLCSEAITDFIQQLPQREDDYLYELREFILRLYSKQISNKNTIYFIDKTPRYYYIIPEIIKTFPDAKFIFLFRNPLSIISSIISSWTNNTFNIYKFKEDFDYGFKTLVRNYHRFKNKSIMLYYEDLILNPDVDLQKIFDYLNLEYNKEVIEQFNEINFEGSKGDKNRKGYQYISSQNLKKWKNTFNSKFRKAYAKKYLHKINKELNEIGYNKTEIIHDLNNTKNKYISFDRFIYFYGVLVTKVKKILWDLNAMKIYNFFRKINKS